MPKVILFRLLTGQLPFAARNASSESAMTSTMAFPIASTSTGFSFIGRA